MINNQRDENLLYFYKDSMFQATQATLSNRLINNLSKKLFKQKNTKHNTFQISKQPSSNNINNLNQKIMNKQKSNDQLKKISSSSQIQIHNVISPSNLSSYKIKTKTNIEKTETSVITTNTQRFEQHSVTPRSKQKSYYLHGSSSQPQELQLNIQKQLQPNQQQRQSCDLQYTKSSLHLENADDKSYYNTCRDAPKQDISLLDSPISDPTKAQIMIDLAQLKDKKHPDFFVRHFIKNIKKLPNIENTYFEKDYIKIFDKTDNLTLELIANSGLSQQEQSPTHQNIQINPFNLHLQPVQQQQYSQQIPSLTKEFGKGLEINKNQLENDSYLGSCKKEFNINSVRSNYDFNNNNNKIHHTHHHNISAQDGSDKVFKILKENDKIIVHTSQNKELMQISNRTEVIELAKWFEDMVNKVQINSQKSNSESSSSASSFNNLFEQLMIIYSACMNEIIRQVTIHISERGQLLKSVWEQTLKLVKQGFLQINSNSEQQKQLLQQKIDNQHHTYLEKLDQQLNQIDELKKEIEKLNSQNRQIVADCRYLRKKDAKLEKYLKQARKEAKTLQDEYDLINKDFLKYCKQSNGNSAIKAVLENKITEKLAEFKVKSIAMDNEQEQQEQEIYNREEQHKINIQKLSKINKISDDQLEKIEQEQNDIIGDGDDNKQKENQKKKNKFFYVLNEPSKNPEVREYIEIESSTGLPLTFASIGVQVETDTLNPVKERGIDTKDLIELTENIMQTDSSHFQADQQVQTDEQLQPIKSPKKRKTQLVSQGSDQFCTSNNGRKESMQTQQQIPAIQDFIIDQSSDQLKTDRQNIFQSTTSINEDIQLMKNNIAQNDKELSNQTSLRFIHKSSLSIQPIAIAQVLEETLVNHSEKDLHQVTNIITQQKQQLQEMMNTFQFTDVSGEKIQQIIKNFIVDQENLLDEEQKKITTIVDQNKKQQNTNMQLQFQLAEVNAELEDVQEKMHLNQILQQKIIESYEQEQQQLLLQQQSSQTKALGNVYNKGHTINSLQSINNDDSESDQEQSQTKSKGSPSHVPSNQQQQEQPPKLKLPLQAIDQSSQETQYGSNQKKSKFQQQPQRNNNRQSTFLNVKSPQKIAESVAASPINDQSILHQRNGSMAQIQSQRSNNDTPRSRENSNFSKNQLPQKTGFSDVVQQQIKRRAAVQQPGIQQDKFLDRLSKAKENYYQQNNYGRRKLFHSNSPNADAANLFLQRLDSRLKGAVDRKIEPTMTMPNVTKQIQTIYQEKIKQMKDQQVYINPLHIVAYDYFLNQFGFKKLAEQKLKQFMNTCIAYTRQYSDLISGESTNRQQGNNNNNNIKTQQQQQQINQQFQIQLFTRFFGLSEIEELINKPVYDKDDLNFFIEMWLSCSEGSPQHLILNNLLSLQRIQDCLIKQFEYKIQQDKLNLLKQELELIKTQDPMNKSKFCIDIDMGLEILLKARQEKKKQSVEQLRNVYMAGDIDGDQMIAYSEYLMLFRHIEKERFNFSQATKLFFTNCDILDEITSSQNMSFSNFAFISVENNLFSVTSQERFTQRVESWDKIKKFDQLQVEWKKKKDIIRLRFIKTGKYNNVSRLMINKVDQFFSDGDQTTMLAGYVNSSQAQLIWLIYRLIDEQSKFQMVEQEIKNYIPNELQLIEGTFQVLVTKASQDNNLNVLNKI